eukprot:jgi/Tetstr1/459668/TSEL_005023.t1
MNNLPAPRFWELIFGFFWRDTTFSPSAGPPPSPARLGSARLAGWGAILVPRHPVSGATTMADRLDYLLSELGGSSSDEEGEAVTEAEAAEWAEARQPRPQPQQQVLPPPPPHPISAPAEADDQEKLEEEGIKEEAKGEGKGEARPDVASGVVSAGLAEVACSAGPEGDSAAAAWDSATAASPGTDGLSKDTLAKPLSPLAAGNDGIIRTPSAGFEEAEPQGLMGGTMPTVAEPQEPPAHDTTASSFLDLSGLEMLEAKELMSSDPAAPPAAQVLEEGGLVPYGPGKVHAILAGLSESDDEGEPTGDPDDTLDLDFEEDAQPLQPLAIVGQAAMAASMLGVQPEWIAPAHLSRDASRDLGAEAAVLAPTAPRTPARITESDAMAAAERVIALEQSILDELLASAPVGSARGDRVAAPTGEAAPGDAVPAPPHIAAGQEGEVLGGQGEEALSLEADEGGIASGGGSTGGLSDLEEGEGEEEAEALPEEDPELMRMAEAYAYEQKLLLGTGRLTASSADDGLEAESVDLRVQLQMLRDEVGPGGRPLGANSMLGREGVLRADPVHGSIGTQMTATGKYGQPQAVVKYQHMVAVGMSSGVVLLQVPASAAAAPTAPSQSQPHPPLPNLAALGEAKPSAGGNRPEGVTALAFNLVGEWLMAGTASGALQLWDTQQRSLLKTITEHQAPVVHICFMPGKPGTVATADARGVLLLHTLSSVPLLRLISVSTKVATDGRSIGPLLDMRPLMPALPPRGAAHPPPGASTRPDASPGGRLNSAMASASASSGGKDVAWSYLFEDANAESEAAGILVLCAQHMAFICRMFPDMAILHSLPRPSDVPPSAVMCACWRPRHRQPLSAAERASGHPPHAMLVIGWDTQVHLYDVPLIAAKRAPASVSPDGAPKSRRGQSSASAGGGTQAPAPSGSADSAPQKVQLQRAFEAASAVIGLHWLDLDGLGVATASGYLQVFDAQGDLKDQVLIEHAPVSHTLMVNVSGGGSATCFHNSIVGWGPHMLLMSPVSLLHARLIPWAERLAALKELGDWAGAILLGLQARDTVAALGGGSPARGGRPPADLEDAAGAAGAWAVNARGVEANALPGQIVGCVKEYIASALATCGSHTPEDGDRQERRRRLV